MLQSFSKIFLLFSVSIILMSYSKIEENDFQKNFNIAKQHLAQRRVSKALPYLQYLQKNYPKNANLKYLIGVCYAEEEIVNPKTLQLLTEASLNASLDYNPNSLEEKRVPIYVYYYLSIAYSQNGQCNKAEEAREKFLEVYPHEDAYYIEESKRWLKVCKGMIEKPKESALPSYPDFKPYTSPKKEAPKKGVVIKQEKSDNLKQESEDNTDKIVTKRIEYTTQQPLYGVQLGAFKEAIPVSRFKSLKNIDAFMDKDGLIRYVIGHFSFESQAKSLLKYIKSQGYMDAFVVNVNNERKYAEEIVSVNDVNIKASIKGKAEYRIQVGAFREEIPEKSASMYLKLEGIREFREGNFTYLTVGDFESYEEAKGYEKGIKATGINDAFIIAIANGKKITLQQAKDLKE